MNRKRLAALMATIACMLGSAAATAAPTTFSKAAANVETAD